MNELNNVNESDSFDRNHWLDLIDRITYLSNLTLQFIGLGTSHWVLEAAKSDSGKTKKPKETRLLKMPKYRRMIDQITRKMLCLLGAKVLNILVCIWLAWSRNWKRKRRELAFVNERRKKTSLKFFSHSVFRRAFNQHIVCPAVLRMIDELRLFLGGAAACESRNMYLISSLGANRAFGASMHSFLEAARI